MTKYSLALALLLIACTCPAQPAKRVHKARQVLAAPPPKALYRDVTQQPAFPGDVAEYLRKHLRYPDDAREYKIEGRADVLFEIRPDGTVRVVSLRRSTGTASLDDEARHLVSRMPKWMPGQKNGVPVRSLMLLPVIFRLD